MKHVATFVISLLAVTSAARADQPLHELAHLDAPVCAGVLVHANAAISATLHDDLVIHAGVLRLRAFDADPNDRFAQRSVLSDLEKASIDLSTHADGADGELKRLRDVEAATENAAAPAPAAGETDVAPANLAHPETLHRFVDSLADAVLRQKKIAGDIAIFTTNMLNYDLRVPPSDEADDQMRSSTSIGRDEAVSSPHITNRTFSKQPSGREQALAAAADFEARSADIRRIEAKAAEESEAAVSGCA